MIEIYMSETSKYRDRTVPFCQGNGVDLGSGGDPVVQTCVSLDLPPAEYDHYNSSQPHRGQMNWRSNATQDLPFKDGVCDFVYSSHLLEDFLDWWPILQEWVRILKVGGHLVILVPDKVRWNEAIRKGQPPNCAHRHESRVGELSKYASKLGLEVVLDEMAKPEDPDDYTIIFVGRKVR